MGVRSRRWLPKAQAGPAFAREYRARFVKPRRDQARAILRGERHERAQVRREPAWPARLVRDEREARPHWQPAARR
jgi:hypothetical protein